MDEMIPWDFFIGKGLDGKEEREVQFQLSCQVSCHDMSGEVFSMKKDLLLVIDMQNVYGPNGAWYCQGIEKAASNIRKIIQQSGSDMEVIFTRYVASGDPQGIWKEYNREYAGINEDPYANAMMAIFRNELEKYPLYTKSVYSSLAIPEVREAVLRADRVILTGVVAECCVLSTAMAVIDAGGYVIYLTDAVAGINQANATAVETVLAGLEPLHLRRMTTDELLSSKKGEERE